MDAFSYTDYREFLQKTLAERKKANPQHSYAWLADRMGVQRSYFSRVLKGDAALSPDQLYLACRTLHLGAGEQEYLLLLLEIDRTGLEERRKELTAERDRLQAKHRKAEAVLKKRATLAANEEKRTEYYLQPLCPLVHMHLTIPKYLHHPALLREKLGLSAAALAEVLDTLEGCGILRVEHGKYVLLESKLHVSSSRLSRAYATQFRLKAIEAQQRMGNDDDYFFTSSFSADRATLEEIRKKFLQFLGQVSSRVEDADPQEVFHLNFDLFRP
jgi:uncharacterized protein (TIGR02147 family)